MAKIRRFSIWDGHQIWKDDDNPHIGFTEELPLGASVLAVRLLNDSNPVIWVICDAKKETVKRRFVLCRIQEQEYGIDITSDNNGRVEQDDLKYIGMYQYKCGVVYHLFERTD